MWDPGPRLSGRGSPTPPIQSPGGARQPALSPPASPASKVPGGLVSESQNLPSRICTLVRTQQGPFRNHQLLSLRMSTPLPAGGPGLGAAHFPIPGAPGSKAWRWGLGLGPRAGPGCCPPCSQGRQALPQPHPGQQGSGNRKGLDTGWFA